MRRTLAVLVENHFGVLARVSGLFSRRGFNIESLAVGPTHDPTISRITVVVDGDDQLVDQVTHQLEKLLEVLAVEELRQDAAVARELCLIKVSYTGSQLTRILEIVRVFRGKVLDMGRTHVTIEISGTESKVNALLDLVREYGIIEMVRSGQIALSRSPEPLPIPQNRAVEVEIEEGHVTWPGSSTTKTRT